MRGRVSNFTNIYSSPWRRVSFTIEIDASFNIWGRVTNDTIQKSLCDHLGFTPKSENYIEVRYLSICARRMRPGTALALRIYRIESNYSAADNKSSVAVIKEVESYASNSFAFPTCSLSWDKVSRFTPLLAKEKQPLFALFPHITDGEPLANALCLTKMTVLYRHASTPFEQDAEPTIRRTPKITTDNLISLTPPTSPFDNININSPADN